MANLKDVATLVAEKMGVTKKDAETAVRATFEVIADSLAKGEDVDITKFGKFTVKDVPAGTRRNPSTGKTFEAPATKKASFKFSSVVKNAVKA